MAIIALIVFASGVFIALDKRGRLTGEARNGLKGIASENTGAQYWKARYLTLELASLLQLNSDTWNAQSLVRAQGVAESLQSALIEIESEESRINSASPARGSAEATLLITQLKKICHDQRTCSQTQLATRLEPSTKLLESINSQYPEVDLSTLKSNNILGDSAAPSPQWNLILGALLMLCGAITGATVMRDLKHQRRPDNIPTPLQS